MATRCPRAVATGVVEEIHIFHTLMRTGDNIQLVVPNSAITGGNISNYSAKETRRIDLVVGCGYGDNLLAVKQFLTDLFVMRGDPTPFNPMYNWPRRGMPSAIP